MPLQCHFYLRKGFCLRCGFLTKQNTSRLKLLRCNKSQHKQSHLWSCFSNQDHIFEEICWNSYLPNPFGSAGKPCGGFCWRLLQNVFFIFFLLFIHSFPTPTTPPWPHNKAMNLLSTTNALEQKERTFFSLWGEKVGDWFWLWFLQAHTNAVGFLGFLCLWS